MSVKPTVQASPRIIEVLEKVSEHFAQNPQGTFMAAESQGVVVVFAAAHNADWLRSAVAKQGGIVQKAEEVARTSPQEGLLALDRIVVATAGVVPVPDGPQEAATLIEKAERLSSVCSLRPFTPEEAEEAVDVLLAVVRLQRERDDALHERDLIGAALGEPCAECGHVEWRSDGYLDAALAAMRRERDDAHAALRAIAFGNVPLETSAQELARAALAPGTGGVSDG